MIYKYKCQHEFVDHCSCIHLSTPRAVNTITQRAIGAPSANEPTTPDKQRPPT